MGYDTKFWIDVYTQTGEIDPDEWAKLLESVHFDQHWQKDWLIKIFLNSTKNRWYDHQMDMLKLSKQLPHLTLKLFGHGEDLEDEWKETYRGGELIGNKHIMDYRQFTRFIKQEKPALYYSYMANPWGEIKPKPQTDRYRLKGFLRGISILRKILHNNAALKIQRTWDHYWYRPNEQGQSRSALAGYANLTGLVPVDKYISRLI